MKFKKGDTVIIDRIKACGDECLGESHCPFHGKTGTITSINDIDNTYCVSKLAPIRMFSECNFREEFIKSTNVKNWKGEMNGE